MHYAIIGKRTQQAQASIADCAVALAELLGVALPDGPERAFDAEVQTMLTIEYTEKTLRTIRESVENSQKRVDDEYQRPEKNREKQRGERVQSRSV